MNTRTTHRDCSISRSPGWMPLDRSAAALERFWPDAARLWKAWMLATTVEVAEALLANESVPVDRLDPEWVRRFGLAHLLQETVAK